MAPSENHPGSPVDPVETKPWTWTRERERERERERGELSGLSSKLTWSDVSNC